MSLGLSFSEIVLYSIGRIGPRSIRTHIARRKFLPFEPKGRGEEIRYNAKVSLRPKYSNLRSAAVSLSLSTEAGQKLVGPRKDLHMLGNVKSLRELFEIELRYAYDCERKLVDKGLPTMIEEANSPELRTALQHHLAETKNQISRLERVFDAIHVAPLTKSNDILDKMMSAAKDSVANIEASPLRDAALIVNGNLVEHYEIAAYGSLAAFARNLGLPEAATLLDETLAEEKKADAKLTEIAQRAMNPAAARHQTA
jgi:ferritin-like metal-binding protein YciE